MAFEIVVDAGDERLDVAAHLGTDAPVVLLRDLVVPPHPGLQIAREFALTDGRADLSQATHVVLEKLLQPILRLAVSHGVEPGLRRRCIDVGHPVLVAIDHCLPRVRIRFSLWRAAPAPRLTGSSNDKDEYQQQCSAPPISHSPAPFLSPICARTVYHKNYAQRGVVGKTVGGRGDVRIQNSEFRSP